MLNEASEKQKKKPETNIISGEEWNDDELENVSESKGGRK
jgi:hypothetical protein